MNPRIGRYTVLLELARGGMAQVFVATDDSGRETFVLKRLLEDLEHNDAVVRRFQREALLASRLDHPNIARIFEVGFTGKEPFLVMEYISGQTVEALLEMMRARNLRMPLEIALPILLGVLDGLAYAHALTDEAGESLHLVHRDLSPRNVMVGYRGEVKIIDFGVARASVDDFKTEPGMLIGTLQYFSPEQAQGAPVDARSDLYTVCAVAFEMITGRPLVLVAKPGDMLARIIEGNMPRPSELDPRIPSSIDRVIHKGLARDRDRRWQSARELAAALREAVGWSRGTNAGALAELMRSLFPGAEAAMEQLIGGARGELERIEAMPVVPVGLDEPELTEVVSGPRTAITEVTERRDTFTQTEIEGPEDEESGLPDTAPRAISPLGPTAVVITQQMPRSRASVVAFALLLVALTLVTAFAAEWVVTTLHEQPNAAASEGPARVEAQVAARPGIQAREPAPLPELLPEPEAKPKPRPSPKPKHTPAADIPRESSAPHADLQKKLAALRAAPGDADLFQELHDAIEARAQNLAPEERRRVKAAIDAALRSGDVDALSRGLERLIAYGRASNAVDPSSTALSP